MWFLFVWAEKVFFAGFCRGGADMHMHTKSGASCAAPLHMHGHCRWDHMPPVHMHTKSGASCAAPLHMHGRTNAHCAYAGGQADIFFTLELRYVGVALR